MQERLISFLILSLSPSLPPNRIESPHSSIRQFFLSLFVDLCSIVSLMLLSLVVLLNQKWERISPSSFFPAFLRERTTTSESHSSLGCSCFFLQLNILWDSLLSSHLLVLSSQFLLFLYEESGNWRGLLMYLLMSHPFHHSFQYCYWWQDYTIYLFCDIISCSARFLLLSL
jgi:hypothetical protein